MDGVPKILTSIEQYSGQRQVAIAATQLGSVSRAQAQRVVAGWMDFFSAGPSPIEELEFVTRTPRRLFDALAGQKQLRRLKVKWGDYEDLTVLASMAGLTDLRLGGASSVRSLDPLAALKSVEVLEIESLRHVRVLDAIGEMPRVRDLELGGDWKSPRIAHVDSIGFLRAMPQVERLRLHTIIVDDLDYSPILSLPKLRSVRVMKARGMRPAHEDLKNQAAWDDVNG